MYSSTSTPTYSSILPIYLFVGNAIQIYARAFRSGTPCFARRLLTAQLAVYVVGLASRVVTRGDTYHHYVVPGTRYVDTPAVPSWSPMYPGSYCRSWNIEYKGVLSKMYVYPRCTRVWLTSPEFQIWYPGTPEYIPYIY